MNDYIDTLSDVARKHFNQEEVDVRESNPDSRDPLMRDWTQEVFKRLAGAPTGSTVHIEHVSYDIQTPSRGFVKLAEITVENHGYLDGGTGKLGIFKNSTTGKLTIYLEYLVLRTDNEELQIPPGFAARMLAIIVKQARLLPEVKDIRLTAAGGRTQRQYISPNGNRWGGYFAWPDYGFDARLDEETLKVLAASSFPDHPNGISGCINISDVLRLKNGRDVWRNLGDCGLMTFDLTPDSWSIKRLNDTLKRKNL